MSYVRTSLAVTSVATALVLASCSMPSFPVSPSNSGSVATGTTAAAYTGSVAAGDTVSVNYVGRLQDGTIFDSSIESEAKKSAHYTAGRKYEPLSFTVGAGQMIKGFDAGVVGMKLGEKKTITIAPKDAYGEATTTQSYPRNSFEDTFTETVDSKMFQDTVTQEVPRQLIEQGGTKIATGEVIQAGSIKATIKSFTDTGVTVSIENPNNPFKGKKIAVGLSGEFEGNNIKVTAITNTGVTVKVDNKSNPFYGRKLALNMTGTFRGETARISELTATGITLSFPNTHELAGKTLIFDVEVTKIEPKK